MRPGITVTVLDNATGAPAACGARAVITSGSYSESVELPVFVGGCPNGMTLSGAQERPGTYTVTVSKAGYHDFIQSSVVVVPDVCHVITANVTARLMPL